MQLARGNVFENIGALRSRFESARPFPHLIIDNFLDEEIANALRSEALMTSVNIDASNTLTQLAKVASTDWTKFGPVTHHVFGYFNSAAFIEGLEYITDIDGLFGDPTLEGGGIHMTRRGGFLKMHTDFNWHAKLRADRRVNALLFLNANWQEDWGGELILSDLKQKFQTRIEPIMNRLVIFNTNDKTLHGHPDAHGFPDNNPRLSIALYYYSAGSPVKERIRGRATTTRYLPRHERDIDLSVGSLRTRVGYLIRKFFKV